MTDTLQHIPVSGPWDHDQLQAYLEEAVIPIRLGTLHGNGYPNIVSLWYLFEQGAFWCAVQGDSYVARQVEADSRCAFEVAPSEPPYRGVRGQGEATVVQPEGERVLLKVINRYLGGTSSRLARWLLDRKESEVAIRIEPARFSTWDYVNRMQDL